MTKPLLGLVLLASACSPAATAPATFATEHGPTASVLAPPATTYPGLAWTKVAPLGLPRSHGNAVSVGGRIYSIGGDETGGSVAGTTAVEVYDAKADRWVQGPDMPMPTDHAAVAASDSAIFVFGGPFANPSARGYQFDVGNGRWSEAAPLPEPRAAAGAAFVAGRVYVVGGFGADRRELSAALAYDPLAQVWERIADLPTPREHLAVVAYRGRVCALGGHFGAADKTTLVECYDPLARSWAALPPLPVAASDFDAAVVGDEIWAVGDDVQVFEGTRWRLGPSLLTPRYGVSAAVIGRSLYVVGGASRRPAPAGLVERLDHP
jgi:hypothetical protein